MKNCLLRSFQAILVFSLAFTLTNCGNLDNPLEELSGGGSGGSSTIAVTGVKLDKAFLRIAKSTTTETLTATVSPAEATDKSVTWKSSDETVATVDASGKITPKKAGTTTITATANDGSGMKATSTVYVYDKIVDISNDISVDADASWLINGTGNTEAKSITIANNSKVTLNGINITKGINCTDNATIILADGSTNTVTAPSGKAGIKIGDVATETLTIDAETEGTGTLTAKGGDNCAGIGTDHLSSGGNIVINGGRVTATGGNSGAGIGTGLPDYVKNTCGAITINGGTVNATGGILAAGIGTGCANASATECGTITINGGTVNATGGYDAAGIGTGVANYKTNTCGAITINGGKVTATGGNEGAGIGTGAANYETNECGAITIKANVTSVTATKGSSSPNSIGKGNAASGGTQNCGTITFGTAQVFDGTAATGTWTPNPMEAGTYGGLKLVISKKNFDNDTWTLTPAP